MRVKKKRKYFWDLLLLLVGVYGIKCSWVECLHLCADSTESLVRCLFNFFSLGWQPRPMKLSMHFSGFFFSDVCVDLLKLCIHSSRFY